MQPFAWIPFRPALAIRRAITVGSILLLLVSASFGFAAQDEPILSPGAKVVWDIAKAWHETTPSRERISLNGLWRWQPATNLTNSPPTAEWGYFKVPGAWPGITDYMQKDCQTVHAHPAWKTDRLGGVTAAWYEREITVPKQWGGRSIVVQVECLNSYAIVFVDGRKAGELRFPGGEQELADLCRPGSKHVLSMLVVALPLNGVMLSYSDTASAREVKGSVARRGLSGDVYLESRPSKARITDARVMTSVRKWKITFDVALHGLEPQTEYTLQAQLFSQGKAITNFTSQTFTPDNLQNGRFQFFRDWKPEQLWNLHTPSNSYTLEMALIGSAGTVLDVWWNERFGFRELWIDGRDFFLNGSRLQLSCVPLDNAQVGAAWATYGAARESFARLKSFGINFVYTHNYGCEPGAHLSFAEILRAADDSGMLVSLSQPHFSHYDWRRGDADDNNGYRLHAEAYARMAGNHPSVVFYSMSHNATGYSEDMNPHMIDGLQDARDGWALNNAKLALRASEIVERLDRERIVYHHASGNLGPLHAINFYPNFVPIQELSDWFEHWATEGVKPVFLCEYGAPFTWDWTMYRGWYRGQREFGSAKVPWEFCLAEWNSQFLGDAAFDISAAEKANLRWEARQFRDGNVWHRWDYPEQVGSTRLEERYPVFAKYLNDAWRAFRTWGVSANSPWEHGHFWQLREGVDRSRQELEVDWENLQRPGFSPDYIEQRYERMDLAFDRSDWIATPAAEALLRNNRDLLGWIGGKTGAFTIKDHVFRPGEVIGKQLILINNSREAVTCRYEWVLNLPKAIGGSAEARVGAGEQVRIPIRMLLPQALSPGSHDLNASFVFDTGERHTDKFSIHVLPPRPSPNPPSRIAIWDPRGETVQLLGSMGLAGKQVNPDCDLTEFEVLIVGKGALTPEGPAPRITRVREGLKVIVFEQTAAVLEQRFGFRVQEHGLRQVFSRIPSHPALRELSRDLLRDWRGASTILSPRLDYELRPRYGPTVQWCGMPATRLWRCGNRGNVASVLIEKPARGNFLPILDGGFSLQYSPLLEFREGAGMVLFCQMDITGRTEQDPAAETLARNIVEYVANWRPTPLRKAAYAGDSAGLKHLETAGFAVSSYQGGAPAPDEVLVAGPFADSDLGGHAAAVSAWVKAGGRLLAIGLSEKEANALLPFQVAMEKAEHISCLFEPPQHGSPLAGVGPADAHNRDPREVSLITSGAELVGNGVLALGPDGNVVFCQIAPWQFHPKLQNQKRTFRRTSFLLTRLLANMGVAGSSPIIERFGAPVESGNDEQRWLMGLYLDKPEEWDDPYRFFRW